MTRMIYNWKNPTAKTPEEPSSTVTIKIVMKKKKMNFKCNNYQVRK
jgi:hypothetical protein